MKKLEPVKEFESSDRETLLAFVVGGDDADTPVLLSNSLHYEASVIAT